MSTHHHFDYFEFPATDISAMKKFYGDVFGWTFQDWGDSYASIHGAGLDGGFDGTSGKRKPSDQGALAVIYSDDLEATEEAVKNAGASITLPTIEFPGGRRFHFADPSGNEVAVWTKVEES